MKRLFAILLWLGGCGVSATDVCGGIQDAATAHAKLMHELSEHCTVHYDDPECVRVYDIGVQIDKAADLCYGPE